LKDLGDGIQSSLVLDMVNLIISEWQDGHSYSIPRNFRPDSDLIYYYRQYNEKSMASYARRLVEREGFLGSIT
jgi:hypothetical protein